VDGGAQPLLAIDTATEQAGIALYDGHWLSEITWQAGRNQTATLLAEIDHLLRINQRTVRQLGAVAVSIGPGGFNGLRVGLSVAKALCYSLHLPLIGIMTLDALAYPFTAYRRPIRAFVPAGRRRYVYTDYRRQGQAWVRASWLRTVRGEQLAEDLTELTVLVGTLEPSDAETLAKNPRVVLPPSSQRTLRPAWLAELAFQRWQRAEHDPLETLEPIYVHAGGSESIPSVELPESY